MGVLEVVKGDAKRSYDHKYDRRSAKTILLFPSLLEYLGRVEWQVYSSGQENVAYLPQTMDLRTRPDVFQP